MSRYDPMLSYHISSLQVYSCINNVSLEKSIRVKKTDTLSHVTDLVYTQWNNELHDISRDCIRLRDYTPTIKQIGE